MVAPTQQQQTQQQQPKQGAVAVGATKTSAEEEALKRNTDCVYFLASPLTCKKGSECEYRHSEYARVNPRDCYYWLNGNCLNPKCGFRHPPLDGLLGTQVAASAGSSMSSSQMAATPTPIPAAHTPYNQGAYNPGKQAVQCVFFQKGNCLKGDRCAFLHGPPANNKAPQPAAAPPAAEPQSLKKTFGSFETSQVPKFPPTNNVPKVVAMPREVKATPKVEAVSTRSGVGMERSVPRPPSLEEELPRHRGTTIASVVNGGSVGRSNRLHQAHALDEQGFHAGKDTDEFLRESSPGFDVLVDDELRDSDFYHGEDQYGGTRGHEGRNVNEYDIGRPASYDAMAGVDREIFRDARDYDSFDHMQGHYDWDRPRASSERISLGHSTVERRGYSRADSPDHMESDLRYRLSKGRRVNGLRSVVSHDHALENHEEERNRGSFRDSHHKPSHEGSLGSRLRGRIKLPGRSLGNGADLRSERETERGRNWGRLSPGKPQTSSHQGRLRDRIKGKVEGDYSIKEGRSVRGPRIRREIMDERNADFEGPKRLSELKVGKNPETKEHQSLGKRKHIEDYQQTEGDVSFEGPMPLSEILKRKRQSGSAASGSGVASVNKEDINQKQSKESLVSGSSNTIVKEESKSTIADTEPAAHGESSQLNNKHEIEEGMVTDERMEDHELEGDDQQDGDYYYEQGEEGEYEEGENVDPEEEYVEEEEGEDGDDFEKKLGVMFS